MCALTTSLVCSEPAIASGGGDGCNPTRSSKSEELFDGMQSYRPGGYPSVGAIGADIDVYSPYVFPGSGDTSQWVMLVSEPATKYEQVGWYEAPGSKRSTFVEDGTNGGSFFDDFYPADPIGSVSYFKVTYNPDTETYGFSDNGNRIDVESSLGDPTPNDVQLYGETHNLASQMPGGTGNKDRESGSQVY